jgi:methionyl-tRNA formyltransferase
VRTIIVGNRELAKHVLAHTVKSDWNIAGVVSPVGEAARRQAGFTSFSDIAEREDLNHIETADINDKATRAAMQELKPDLCICPGWHDIIDEAVLEIPTRGFVGFHSSRLPEGRGGAPVNWSLIAGAEEVWISMFYYSTGVDDGPIIAQKSVPIAERDDVSTVFDRLSWAACDLLSEQREPLQNDAVSAIPQSLGKATYRPRRQPQDGLINWGRTAESLYDWVRAQTSPYPGAYTFCNVGKLRIWGASPVVTEGGSNPESKRPGTVLQVVDGEGVDIATGTTPIRLERVQTSTQPAMWADDFADHVELAPGDVLGRVHAPRGWIYTGIRDAEEGTNYQTNLKVGEQAEILGVLDVPNGDQDVLVEARLGDHLLLSASLHVSNRMTLPIEYAPSSPGTRTLRVEFASSDSGEILDRRFLKIFSPQ